jgi:hypothetical protein
MLNLDILNIYYMFSKLIYSRKVAIGETSLLLVTMLTIGNGGAKFEAFGLGSALVIGISLCLD